jgi:hypothetical protein
MGLMKMGFLNMYMYLPVAALLIGMGFVFFAGDSYRYPCQDPANWSTPDCEPPACTASGTCTSNLITLDGTPVTAEQMSAMVAEIEATQDAVGIKPAETPTETETQPLYEEVQ